MRRLLATLLTALTCTAVAALPVRAANPGLERKAAELAAHLAASCPKAAFDDMAAFQSCAMALRQSQAIPFGRDILWGGEQPTLRIRKKMLTHFSPQVFQWMYMPLMVFTGHWSVDHDDRDKVDLIRIEAYFRNGLPPSQYPYPFWHSAAKWAAYQTMNRINFYLAADGTIFLATRSDDGSNAARGPYAAVTPPAFDGKWNWQDNGGQPAPRTMLFSSEFSSANPVIARLDRAYRDFAMNVRQGSCLNCHTPSNAGDASRLVLLQTPIHAAGEIENVIRQVRNGNMPQDDVGLRKDIPPTLRATILQNAEIFRDRLNEANQWEAANRPSTLRQ